MCYLLLSVPIHPATLRVHRNNAQEKHLRGQRCLAPGMHFVAPEALIPTETKHGGKHVSCIMLWYAMVLPIQHIRGKKKLMLKRKEFHFHMKSN